MRVSYSPLRSGEQINFSSDTIGDGFINLVKSGNSESTGMSKAIDFVSSPLFCDAFGSTRIVDCILDLLTIYPEKSELTHKLLKVVNDLPAMERVSELATSLPDNFFESLPGEIRESIAESFSFSSDPKIADMAQRFCKQKPSETIQIKSSIVSISDIFNEHVEEIVANPNSLQPYIEQMQPFSTNDIADFIANLADENNDTLKCALPSNDRQSLVPLLRQFKGSKVSVEQVILALDKERIGVTTQASMQFLLSCLKEVSGSRVIPALPFFGTWHNPKTQLELLSLIILLNQQVSFPKPDPLPRINSVIMGDFKADFWRSTELVETVAYLYNFAPVRVDAMLESYMGKGPGLLLLVLAQKGNVCPFAAHLLRLLLFHETQYMAGVSALWATSPKYVANVCYFLYNEHRSVLGKCCDLVDDLCIWDEFLDLVPHIFRVLLHISAFFRRGNDIGKGLEKLYAKDKTIVDVCFKVLDNPSEYGIFAPMKTERIVRNWEKGPVSADLLVFTFLEGIYKELNSLQRSRLRSVFNKCLNRTPELGRVSFIWNPVEVPRSPKEAISVVETDYLSLAVSTNPEDITKFRITVASLLQEIPQGRQQASVNGEAVGKLLACDLFSQEDSTRALRLIDTGLNHKENSPGFMFAITALREIKDRFDLYVPFTSHIVSNAKFRKQAPDIHQAAILACEPKASGQFREEHMDISFPLSHHLERFRYLRLPDDKISIDRLNTDPTNLDMYALFYVKSEITQAAQLPQQLNPKFLGTCIEAALFLVHTLITSPNARQVATRCSMTRLGRWLGLQTLHVNRPLFDRLLNISQLLLYSYSASVLSTAIPFIFALFENVSAVFKPPNPWVLHILSILSAFYRLPYLRGSIRSVIYGIFKLFHLSPGAVEPYPLLRLKLSVVYDNDFFYPPFDFSSSLSSPTMSQLLDGDISALFHVVHQHFIISPQQEEERSRIVQEVVLFAYMKVPAIGTSAAMTAFSLALKDFARTSDPIPVKRYSKALLIQLINGLSMMAVSLMNDPGAIDIDYVHRSILNANMRWIDLLIRQLAYHVAVVRLEAELEPIQRLRQARKTFWDVKSFPPSVAARLPPALWPRDVTEQRDYRPVQESPLVATGLYQCFNVDPAIKTVYNNFSLNPLSISVPDVYLSELPINFQLANFVFSNYVLDEHKEISSVKRTKPGAMAMTMPPITTVATLVYCFQPMRPKVVAEYGAELVNYFFGTLDEKIKPQLQGEVHFLLAQQMPDMRVFVELVRRELIDRRFVEILAMNFIDSPENAEANFAPLIDLCFELIQTGKFYPNELERLFCFLCTRHFSALSRDTSEHLQSLKLLWMAYRRKETKHDHKSPAKQESAVRLLDDWSGIEPRQVSSFVASYLHYIRDSNFLASLIIASYPSQKRELLKLLYAAVESVKMRKDEVIMIIRCFLNAVFSSASTSQISMSYFVSLVSSVLLEFRVSSLEILTVFGGFVKDLLNFHRFVGVALCIFPIAIQPLLLEDGLKGPTSRLVVSVLNILNSFPTDWSSYPKFRSIYKSILRILLLICHDAPQFIAGYYFDFVTVIPMRFKRLKNIVLCCRPPSGHSPLFMPFLSSRIDAYDSILHTHSGVAEKVAVIFNEWTTSKRPLEVEIGQFLLYTFKDSHERGIQFDKQTIATHPLWNMTKLILLTCKTVSHATAVVESLFDQISFSSLRTELFSTVVLGLWTISLNWDGITIQNIISDVLQSRTLNMDAVPTGTSQIHMAIFGDAIPNVNM